MTVDFGPCIVCGEEGVHIDMLCPECAMTEFFIVTAGDMKPRIRREIVGLERQRPKWASDPEMATKLEEYIAKKQQELADLDKK
jgi:NMD protein affecting ribosome stability and mRNA decay